MNQQAAFSDDDEEVYEATNVSVSASATAATKVSLVPVIKTTPTPMASAITPTTTTTTSLQAQLSQLMQRPYKIYATIDETLQTASRDQLENQLNMLVSDELRDKLVELNTRLKDFYQVLKHIVFYRVLFYY